MRIDVLLLSWQKKTVASLSDIQERRKPTCLYGFKIISNASEALRF